MIPLWRPSPNFAARPRDSVVDMLVLHYTGMTSSEAALQRLCDPAAELSAHYLIDTDGQVTQLVAEQHRAWHAGRSSWRGATDVNSRSVGIELANPGHAFGYVAFPAAQMRSLADLASAILCRWPIPPRNVVGHADVAPTRKQDPGELFDWRWLAERGIGLWPQPAPATESPETMLRQIGYGWSSPDALPAVVTAFQRHFRPARCDGVADDEVTALLAGLQRLL